MNNEMTNYRTTHEALPTQQLDLSLQKTLSSTPRAMTTQTRLHFLLLGLFVCIYLLPSGIRPLMEPDETRYGEIPREMIATGNWISPHLNGLRYFEKPPLGYWLNAASILAFGENEFAIRLPSALSVGLSALLILLLIRKSCPRQEIWAGPIAALVFLTSFEVPIVGTFGVLDSMFAAALTWTMTCFFLASQAKQGSTRRRWLLIAAGIGCGLAFLIKGFLAMVVPALTMGAYLAWERRWRDLLGLAWLPLLTATLTVLPWGLAIHHQEPDFWNFFFWHEHVQRFLGGKEKAQHAESIWYFFLIAPAVFLPWTFLLPAAGLGLRKHLQISSPHPETRKLIRFCLAWFTLPFLFFSLSSGKLLTYILPCFPPFAILVGLGLLSLMRSGRIRSFQAGAKSAFFIFALTSIAFIFIQFIGINGIDAPYARIRQWLPALIGLAAFTLLPLLASQIQNINKKVILFGLSPVILLCLAPFLIPDQTNERKSPGALLLEHKNEISADTIILSDETVLRAACWYLKRSDIFLVQDAGETTYGLGYPEAKGRLLSLTMLKNTIHAHQGKIILVAKARTYRQWIPFLPNPSAIYNNGKNGYIFATF
jgi:4-amino-4-deoxy-L-arabinose transferase